MKPGGARTIIMRKNIRRTDSSEFAGIGCTAAVCLVITIVIEGIGLCIAAGGAWPLLLWAVLTGVYCQMRA